MIHDHLYTGSTASRYQWIKKYSLRERNRDLSSIFPFTSICVYIDSSSENGQQILEQHDVVCLVIVKVKAEIWKLFIITIEFRLTEMITTLKKQSEKPSMVWCLSRLLWLISDSHNEQSVNTLVYTNLDIFNTPIKTRDSAVIYSFSLKL